MVIIKKLIIYITYITFFVIIYSKNIHSNQILDYETENFINKLIVEIRSVNKFDRNIKISIIKDKNPNVTQRKKMVLKKNQKVKKLYQQNGKKNLKN